MKSNRVIAAFLIAAFLFLSGCELLTPKAEVSKDAYFSAPSMGKASDLPDTGATDSIDGSTPDGVAAADSLYQLASGVVMSLITASKPTLTPQPSMGSLTQEVRGGYSGMVAGDTNVGRSLLGSKTPVEVSFDVMSFDKNTKIGTGKFKMVSYLETSAESDAMATDGNSGDPSKLDKWLGRTLKDYAVQQNSTTLSGDLTVLEPGLVLTARAIQSGNLRFAFDMTMPATTGGIPTITSSVLLDMAFGIAVSVKQVREDGTSLGGKYLVSFARHFSFSDLSTKIVDNSVVPDTPPLTYSYTVRGYNDADRQVFSKTYTITMGAPAN